MPIKYETLPVIIDDLAIRIILLKTVVGFEMNVFDKYSEHLDSLGDAIHDWWCYKIFGEYDLCFIIVRNDFKHDMLSSGTIEGITYSTELLCYKFGATDLEMMKENFRNMPLIGISILKFEPSLLIKQGFEILEQSYYREHLQNLKRIYCLGSFGWSEFVLLYPTNSFADIYSEFVSKALDYDAYNNNSLFIKSFSLVGLNYNILKPERRLSSLNDPINCRVSGLFPTQFQVYSPPFFCVKL